MPFHQEGAGALVAPIFSSPSAQANALVFGHGIEMIFALFATGENPGGVKLAGSTATIGFAAFAAEQIEGALDHRIRAPERVESFGHGGVGAPKLLAELGDIGAQSVSCIYLPIQIASAKFREMQETHEILPLVELSAGFKRFYAHFLHCLNRSSKFARFILRV